MTCDSINHLPGSLQKDASMLHPVSKHQDGDRENAELEPSDQHFTNQWVAAFLVLYDLWPKYDNIAHIVSSYLVLMCSMFSKMLYYKHSNFCTF